MSGVIGEEVMEGEGRVDGGGKVGITGPTPPPPLGPGNGGSPRVTGGKELVGRGGSGAGVYLSIGDQ